jgi:hypothetical protein
MTIHGILSGNILGQERRLGIGQPHERSFTIGGHFQSEEFVVRPIDQVSKAFDATVVNAFTSVLELPGTPSKAEVTVEAHGVVLRINVGLRKISSVLHLLVSGDPHFERSAMIRQDHRQFPSFPSEQQPSLSLPETFLPSQQLLNIWIDCLSELAESSGRQNVAMAIEEASLSERAHQFAQMFRATIGSYAQYARFEETNGQLMTGGRFSAPFQLALTDQFYVVPDRATKFLDALAADFIKALEKGWSVQGEWGKLILTAGGDVSINFKPIEFFEDPDFVESEDVE